MGKIETVIITIALKVDLSWADAFKLRLAGGKAAEKWWNALADKMKEKHHE